jgi:Methylase of polypeptide chain release factors
LCPRPETEELVEYVAKDIRQMIELLRIKSVGSSTCGRKVRILDVGCGTGAIGIALANMFPKDVIVSSMDVSEDAVALSVENAKFVLGDDFTLQYHHPLLCSVREYTRTHLNKNEEEEKEEDRFANCLFEYDVVVSNPPYIPSHDMSTLTADVVEYEDYGALCGGQDGLDVVRDIVERLPEWCKVNHDDNDTTTGTNNGKVQRTKRPFPAVCWMEVDTSHPRLIQSLLANNKHVEYNCEIQDFSGMDRFVKLLVKD